MEDNFTMLSFEEIKKLAADALKDSESNRTSDFMYFFVKRIYLKGKKDGIKRGICLAEEYRELCDRARSIREKGG